MGNLKQILNQCLLGDEIACKKLYEMFLPYCYGICSRYGVQQTDIKDQIQIIFSSTFKSLKNFDDSKASFKTWFTRICINKIIEQRRKRTGDWNKVEFNEEELVLQYDHSLILDEEIDRNYILKILGQMPQQYQSVFNLFIIDGFTHKEISNKLNITEGASRVILKRARGWAQQALTSFLKLS